MKQKIIQGDSLVVLSDMRPESVDVVCTSPVYNLGIKYNEYKDNLSHKDYLTWIHKIFSRTFEIMKPEASFFLNVGFSNADPWIAIDVANEARKFFTLQNNLCWVKSISIGESTHGHFKPIQSKRYLNGNWEHIFHFTKTGSVTLDRLSVGVPYKDKSNIKRWKHTEGRDRRCKGNTWFIPNSTIQSKTEKGNHPAVFPIELPLNCIKLHGLSSDMVVIDPFMGVGTTLQACQILDVAGVGIDIDSVYCEEAKKRLTHPQDG